MKKTYVDPEIRFIGVFVEDVIMASDDEVFVDGEDLFGGF